LPVRRRVEPDMDGVLIRYPPLRMTDLLTAMNSY